MPAPGISLEDLLTRRLALVAAHPDDETIGAGALLARRGGLDALIHVTDGAPRNMADARARGFERREDYAAARRAELLSALHGAGVAPAKIACLDVADQDAALHLAVLCRRLAATLAEADVELVLTHPYEGGHPDHDSAAFAVNGAARLIAALGGRTPAVVEMTSYHAGEGGLVTGRFLPREDAGEEIVVTLDAAEDARKRRMLDAFATQRSVLAPFGTGEERFRLAPSYRFDAPPHDGPLYYEGFDWGMTGERWRALALAAALELGWR